MGFEEYEPKCIKCGGDLRIRSSRRPHEPLKEIYVECKELSCGWRGKGHITVRRDDESEEVQ